MATTSQPETTSRAAEQEDSSPRMSFFDHLAELRTRLLYAVLAVAAGLVIGLYFSDDAFALLAEPIRMALRESGRPDTLVYLSPIGPINLYIKLGLYLGLIIASPIVLHQLWLFVAPGLYRHERRAVVSFVFSGVFLFLAGIAFGYFALLPVTLKFLISIQGPFSPMISINEYFDLVLVILLGLGLIFQLPILIFFLSLFGLVTPGFLWRNFQYAVLVIAIAAAVITPTTDVLTMCIFMAPMIVLYLLGIGVAALVGVRKEGKSGAKEARLTTAVVVVLSVTAGIAALAWAGVKYGWWRLPW
ncbi:MAG TPA: twin-arginine translocase subunit TatC [Candidatus Nitrosotenuis sp.]|nr:twin-arginine translocase subunit TatC [Candidatus Nitrosotenuis sp.]